MFDAAAPFLTASLKSTERMDKGLAELLEEYVGERGHGHQAGPADANRTGEQGDPGGRVPAPHDDVRKIIKGKDRIPSDCACTVQRSSPGHHCDQPVEVCMVFDFYADYYVATGMGRWGHPGRGAGKD